MNSRKALVLHKSEWDRIRRMHNDVKINSYGDYMKSLNEISQSWIKSWPDTEEGHVNLVQKRIKVQKDKNLAYMKEYISKQKVGYNKDSIKRARELIFNDSCYGRQLISAFLESKTFEERDAQIEFQNKSIAEAKRDNTSFLCNSIESAEEMERKENLGIIKQKIKNKEAAEINKMLIETNREKTKDIKDESMQDDLYHKRLLAIENLEKEKKIIDTRKEIERFMEEQADIKERKRQEEEETLQKIEMIRQNQDRIACKIHNINNKLIRERHNNMTEKVYEQLKVLKDKERERYDKFIEAGVQRKLILEAELNETSKKMKARNEKIESKNKRSDDKIIINKSKSTENCLCDRQCILTKSCRDNMRSKTEKEPITPDFVNYRNKLVEKYKQRQQEPSSWSGLGAAHAQFAEHAAKVLEECRYKHAARNVIDEYRRNHYMVETNLLPGCSN